MSGTKAGGKKAAKTTRKLHGEDFYKRIGAIGGKNGHKGGFAANPDMASYWGRIGGKKSVRSGAYTALLEINKKRIKKMYFDHVSYAEIAREIGIPYAPVRRYIRQNIKGYYA